MKNLSLFYLCSCLFLSPPPPPRTDLWLKFIMNWQGVQRETELQVTSELELQESNTGPQWEEVLEWPSGEGVCGFEKEKCTERVKETKRKRGDSGWRVEGEVGVYVTVSKPQEQQRKAVNGSSPCLNRLWTVLQSSANHRSSWRLLWVRALTRCLRPDQGDDGGRGEWKRQKEKEEKKKQKDEEGGWCSSGRGNIPLFFFLLHLGDLERSC